MVLHLRALLQLSPNLQGTKGIISHPGPLPGVFMFMLRGGAGVGPAVRVARGGGGVRGVRRAALGVVPARPARVAGERRATSTGGCDYVNVKVFYMVKE